MQPEPTLLLLDPAELLLHEEVEPARIEQLMATLAAERRQREPVLVTSTPHGMLLLDGAHRTTALRRLGVPRVAAQLVPAEEAGRELTGWTHAVADPGARARLAELAVVAPGAVGPRVALIHTTAGEVAVHASGDTAADLMAAYRGVAERYQGGPYARVPEPTPLPPGETRVVWHVPDLTTIVTLAATLGVLPAGVTRFRPGTVAASIDVGFDELGAPTSVAT